MCMNVSPGLVTWLCRVTPVLIALPSQGYFCSRAATSSIAILKQA